MKKLSISISLLLLVSILIGACSVAPSALISQGAANFVQLAPESIGDPSNPVAEDELAQPAQVPTDPGVIAAYENTLTNVYEKVNPSVVFISVKVDQDLPGFNLEGMPDLPFEHPEIPGNPDAPEPPDLPPFGYGSGSGFVWDQAGHIVTNNHVVDGAVEIDVIFADGTNIPAELVGADPYSDLAVIKVDLDASQLAPIEVTDSRDLKVGELAIAIGNPFGLDGTMTVGIVSALGRTLPAGNDMLAGQRFSIPNVIQTDAPINPGNSGGVLVDESGKLIGVPTAIESPSGVNSGIGFAVPSDTVQRVVPSLIEDGDYQHAYLGISGVSLNPDLAEAMGLDRMQRGTLVTEAIGGGPAEEAGLRGSDQQVEIDGLQVPVGGDVIIAIEGEKIRDMDDLIAYLVSYTTVGQEVTLTILRDGMEVTVNVTLSERPSISDIPQQPEVQPERPDPSQNPNKARLGITGGSLTPEIAGSMGLSTDQRGVIVEDVQENSPAEQAGLTNGDVIIALNGDPIGSIDGLISMLGKFEPGDTVSLTVLRDNDTIKLEVILGEANR